MRLFIWEVRKLFGDSAARAGLVVTAVVLVFGLFATAIAPGPEGPTRLTALIAAGKDPSLAGAPNGWLFARKLLDPVTRLLAPAIICVVLAGLVAGESESGTLDENVARPVRRWRMVAAKLAAGLAYVAALVAIAAFFGLVLGPLVFGTGELRPADMGRLPPAREVGGLFGAVGAGGGAADLGELGRAAPGPLQIARFPSGEALWRLLLAYAAAGAALAPVAALAVIASAAVSRVRTAAVFSCGVYFGLVGVGSLQGLESLRPYLIVTRMNAWRWFLTGRIAWSELARAGLVLGASFVILSAGAGLILAGREFPPRKG